MLIFNTRAYTRYGLGPKCTFAHCLSDLWNEGKLSLKKLDFKTSIYLRECLQPAAFISVSLLAGSPSGRVENSAIFSFISLCLDPFAHPHTAVPLSKYYKCI